MRRAPIFSRRGSVLIVVLWASLGLVSISLIFGHSMVMSYRGADNDLAGRQAELAIEGAARYIETLLADAETPGLFPELTTYERAEVPVGEATFWLLGRPADATATTTREFAIVDEASKLNLNTATLAMLGLLPGMTEELAVAIDEWRKTEESANSASSQEIKHGPFESVEELGLVAGMTREILYGEDTNLNGVLDPNEDDGSKSLPEDNSDGKLDPGILEYVTVGTREPNTQADGTTARVNVAAQPPAQELTTLLTETFGETKAQEIIGRLGGGAPITSVLQFYVRSGMTVDEFGQIVDKITATGAAAAGAYRTGLVNVNTASETVLACLPGIGTEKASSLVAARLSRSQPDTNIAWAAEILEDGVNQAGAFLTGQSWQVSADVAAVGRHGRGYRRARFVIDQSTGTPRIIYRRNLAGTGWALGTDIRDALALKKNIR